MASGFNLTAQINLRGPSNIPQIAADIRRQLGSINANVNFRLDPTAARNVTQLNANLQNFNRTLTQTATSANNAANAIRNLSNAINRVNAGNLAQSLNAASSATAQVSRSMGSVSRSTSIAASEMVEFGKQSGLAIRRFAAFSTVTGVVYGVVNAINQGVKAYIDYDRELVKLQQVTGQSVKGLESLERMITSLATNLGVGSSELTQISSTLAQAGLSARDTERALKALALSSLAPSFDSMNETVEGSIALMRQFGIGAGDLEKALGSVNSVAAKFAVEAADLITAIQRTGGVFATASKGVSEGTNALNEFLAVFTSVRATTRESAETIATGLRTIFTRIQREDTINALKEYGVNLTDLDGKFVGAYKAVEALSQGLSRLDPRDLKFSRIVEELGGFRQIGKVIPLIQQFATAQEALKVAQTGQGSLTADAAKAQESLAVQTSKVREEFLALFREIGKSDSFQTIVKGALSVTSALIKTADSVKSILPILGVMLAFKGVSAVTQFGAGFVQGVRGSGGARGLGQRFAGGRSEGGEIKFASGGLVPGIGDGDTVRAKLTPGEFVMRKSAVKTIGVNKLQALNKYASGGTVREISKTAGVSQQLQRAVVNTKEEPFRVGNAINSTDRFIANINRNNITKQMVDNDIRTKKIPANLLGKMNSGNVRTKGKAFEDYLILSKRTNLKSTRGKSEIYPVDFDGVGNSYAEAKNVQDNINEDIFIDKLFRARVADRSYSRVNEKPTSEGNQNINLGKLTVFQKAFSLGGLVKKFKVGGGITAADAAEASRSDIIRVLRGRPGGIDATAKKVGISAAEIYGILGVRNPDARTKSLQDAIRHEYMITSNRRAGAAKGQITKLQQQNLEVAAAGMFGSAFPDQNVLIESPLLSQAATVRMVSGVMNPKIAEKLERSLTKGIDKLANKISKKMMIADVLDKFSMGRELNLDFDRTLAFGADKILSDPKTPVFGEFSDRNKVSEALKRARLSNLGRELAGLVSAKPDLIPFMRVISARPQSTLDLVQQWLAGKGLPIPLSQFRGLGGPSVSAQQIAQLKAGLLNSGSLFVDDDSRNIAAADARGDVNTYQYGAKLAARNINTDSTIQGGLIEKVIQNLGGPGAIKGLGFDFPNGLQGAAKYFGISPNIPTDVKRTVSGPSTIKDNTVTYLKNVMGYADGGTVPAMVSNGEAYVPPELAKRIGYGKLNKLNQADRNKISGFSSGGIGIFKGAGNGTSDSIGPISLPVGSFILRQKATEALGLYNGGAVQAFAGGGSTVLPARPANPTVENVRIPDNVLENLRLIAKALTDVGLASSSSALILRKNSNITYRETERVIEADIRRMRVAGMSAETITAAETQLRETRRQGARSILTRQRFDGVSGDQLQRIDTAAQASRSLAIQRAIATGMTEEQINDQGFQRRLTNTAYRQATQNITGTAAGVGVSGNSIQQYINQTMMDRRTLAQMDRQYIAQRRQEILNQLRAEQGDTATRAQIRQAASQALTMAQQEVKERRQILNQIATNNGIAGPGRGGILGTGMNIGPWSNNFRDGAVYRTLSPMLAGVYNRSIGGNMAAAGRGISSLGGGLAGQGGFFLSMGVGMLAGQGQNIAGLIGGNKRTQAGTGAGVESGLSTFGSGLALASGMAMIPGIGPFAAVGTVIASGVLAFTEGLKAAGEATKEFDKSLREKNIASTEDRINKALEIFNKTGNASELMSASSISGSLVQENLLINAKEEAVKRSQSRTYFGWMMGESKPILGSEDYRSMGRENAKLNEPAAQAARSVIESQIQKGRDFGDIVKDPGFSKLADTISRADPAFMAFVATTYNMTKAERDAAIEQELAKRRIALMGDAAFVAANRTAIAARAMEAANKSAIELRQTFESMARSFEQAIGRFQFESNRSDKIIESINEDLVGKSSVGKVRSRDLNVLENPQAYNEMTRRETSARVSRQMVGSDRQGLSVDERNNRKKEERLIDQALNTDPVVLSNRLIGSIKSAPSSGKTFDQIAISATSSLDNIMNAQGIPAVIQSVVKKQVQAIIDNISNDKNSTDSQKIEKFNEEIQNTLGDGKIVEPIKQMAIGFLKAKEELDTFSESINKSNELQSNANRLRSEAKDIRIQADMAMTQAIIGAPASLSTRRSIFNSNISGLTGGATDSTGIRRNIEGLTARKTDLDRKLENAKDSGQNTIDLEIEIGRLSTQINNNKQALDTLANSTDLASAAMEQLNTAQRMQASRLQNIDQILSSTPEELQKFNESIIRITQRSQGINPGPSREAFKAYNQAFKQTRGNFRAAQMAAYAQMAQDRAYDLQTMGQYKDTYILNRTNQGFSLQEAILDYERKAANVRGQMMQESGFGGIPGIGSGIMSVINPMTDRLVSEASEELVRASNLQARAKEEQAILNNTAAIINFELAVKKATEGFALLQDLFARMQKETAININNAGKPSAVPAPSVIAQPFPFNGHPVTRSGGGVIYASSGKMVNFEPRGTDTVPAMLTPGEFVVNAKATSQHLPLLRAINNGVETYSSGGIVYLQDGGRANAPTGSMSRGIYLLNKYGTIDYSDPKQMEIYQKLNPKDKEAWERAERVEFRNSLARSGPSEQEIRRSTEKEIKDSVRRDRKQAEIDKSLGIDTRHIDRDIYTDGSGGFSYNGSSSARISVEEQKNRERTKAINSNNTFTSKNGKFSRTARISDIESISGTIYLDMIDAKTGDSLFRQSSVLFDNLDTRSQNLVMAWARTNMPEHIYTDNTGKFDTIAHVDSVDYTNKEVRLWAMNPRRESIGSIDVPFNRLSEESLKRAVPDLNDPSKLNMGGPRPKEIAPEVFVKPEIKASEKSTKYQNINEFLDSIASRRGRGRGLERTSVLENRDLPVGSDNSDGMGVIEGLSGAFSTPGAMARELLAGRSISNALDFTGDGMRNRTSGRDLLRSYGLVGSSDTWANFSSGLLAELLTDPSIIAAGPGLNISKILPSLGKVKSSIATSASAFSSTMKYLANLDEIPGIVLEGTRLGKLEKVFKTLGIIDKPVARTAKPLLTTATKIVRNKADRALRITDDQIQEILSNADDIPGTSVNTEDVLSYISTNKQIVDALESSTTGSTVKATTQSPSTAPIFNWRSVIDEAANALDNNMDTITGAREQLPVSRSSRPEIDPKYIERSRAYGTSVSSVNDEVSAIVRNNQADRAMQEVARIMKEEGKRLERNILALAEDIAVGRPTFGRMRSFGPRQIKNASMILAPLAIPATILAINGFQYPTSKKAKRKQSGGIIYASNGTLVPYEPRGTDTVPAMLTPGEFVINRAATQKHLPLLHAINSGAMSSGGVVYAQDGSLISDGKMPDPYATRLSDTAVYNNISQPIMRSFSLLRDQQGKLKNTSNDTKFIKDKVPSLLTSKEFTDTIDNKLAFRSSGGVVYASNGILVNYQPRGTDTVPAMLTPGEFVINRAATNKHLPLLKAINSGAMSNGGVVYAQNGGSIDQPDPDAFLVSRGNKANSNDSAVQAIKRDQYQEKARNKAYELFLRRFGRYRPEDPQSAKDIVEILRKKGNKEELERAARSYKQIQDAKTQIDRENKANFDADKFSHGGIIYAQKGGLAQSYKNLQLSREYQKPIAFAPPGLWSIEAPPAPERLQSGLRGQNKPVVSYDEWKLSKYVFARSKKEAEKKLLGLGFFADPVISAFEINKKMRKEKLDKIKTIKREDDIDTLRREIAFQKQIPGIEDFNLSNNIIADSSAKVQSMIDDINKEFTPQNKINRAMLLLGRAKLRYDYLQEITNNIKKVKKIFIDKAIPVKDPDHNWLIDQEMKADQETQYITSTINELLKQKPEFTQIIRNTLRQNNRGFSNPVPKNFFNQGGLVYAANGALIAAQQSGTDTVPAMLTPGEFVINREASQKYMPVLHAINKGYYNQGGIVQYLANGGIVSPQYHAGGGVSSKMSVSGNNNLDMSTIKQLSESIASLKETFGSLDNVRELGDTLKQATANMGQHISTFGENISNIPQQVMHDISATVTQHVLGINGAEERYSKQFDGKMNQVAFQHSANIVSNLNKSSEGALTNGNPGSIIGSQGAIV